MAKMAANENLDNVARLLDLVPFLTSHQGIALEELAKSFGVSPAQITKDLTTLWMCGLPGYTAYELIDLSFESGFVTISNAQTLEKPRALSRDEVLALLLGLETLLEELKEIDDLVSVQINSMIKRLSSLADSSVGLRVRAGDASNSSLLAKCESAIGSRAWLLISYHSISRDEITSRRIQPFEIFIEDKYSYLSAYCEISRGVRTFRVDRILDAAECENDDFYPSRIERNGDSPELRISVNMQSRLRDGVERLRPFSTLNPGDATQLEIACFSQEWAIREIMSFGGEAILTSHPSLRAKIVQRAQRALLGYATDH